MVFENLKKKGEMLKQAMDMKSKMKDVQKKLQNTEICSDDGIFKIVLNGELEVKEVKLNPDIVPDEVLRKKLEGSIQKGTNKGIGEAKSKAASQFSDITKGMNLPGMT
ncbi:MAG: YbaB/EbfC family nucleoid-associated protein [Candidatus Margulisbacteria bacterium]|nr:YbaB/EbfC family nucleoid-associated protein [Candidatus Margulisiibacteriota bacterium]